MALSAEVPEDLKPLVNFLKRAEELDYKDPVVAYYCKGTTAGARDTRAALRASV